MSEQMTLTRNLGMELVRATEAAALAAARPIGAETRDVTVIILARPRHEQLIREIREAGARIKLIGDGDVAAAIAAATPGTGVDVLMGTGGAPEAVVAATAIKVLGGNM